MVMLSSTALGSLMMIPSFSWNAAVGFFHVSIVDLSLSLAMLTCLKKEVNLHPEVYSFLGWMYPNILTDCCPSRFSLTTTILNNLLIFCGGFMYIYWTSYLFVLMSESIFLSNSLSSSRIYISGVMDLI